MKKFISGFIGVIAAVSMLGFAVSANVVGNAANDVAEGAGDAVKSVAEGASDAVEGVVEGAEDIVGGLTGQGNDNHNDHDHDHDNDGILNHEDEDIVGKDGQTATATGAEKETREEKEEESHEETKEENKTEEEVHGETRNNEEVDRDADVSPATSVGLVTFSVIALGSMALAASTSRRKR